MLPAGQNYPCHVLELSIRHFLVSPGIPDYATAGLLLRKIPDMMITRHLFGSRAERVVQGFTFKGRDRAAPLDAPKNRAPSIFGFQKNL